MFGWCSWLSRQSNTLKVPGSIPGSNIFILKKAVRQKSNCGTNKTDGPIVESQLRFIMLEIPRLNVYH